MDGPDSDHYGPTPGLARLEGTGITSWQSLTSGVILPMTYVELPDDCDIDTGTRCCGRTAALLVRDETGCVVVAT